MPDAAPVYRLVERRGPARRLVLRQEGQSATRLIVCSSYEGPDLPEFVTAPELQSQGAGWLLHCREGRFEFRARAVQRIEMKPSLYEPLHRRFALSGGDRLAVRALLALLRLPGGARLLRFWHSRRG